MHKLQDSVFSMVKTTNLSPAVFSFLQPSDEYTETPLGGILSDTRHGWLALGAKFCVIDLRTGLKVAARTFGGGLRNVRTTVTNVVELPTPLTDNSQQLLISLECEDNTGLICVFHVNGSQILRCIQTEVVITELAVCDGVADGPFTCFDGVVMAGTKSGEVFAFDLNRSSLIQALKDISQGYEHLIRSEDNAANLTFLPLKAVHQIEERRDLALENDDHLAVLLNETSLVDGQYIFRNPDATVRMKAKRDHIRVSTLQYISQLGSLVVGYNFGAFQIWNLMSLDLEFTSQVNVECLPVTHFGFQEPCDDPRAFCYLWVVFSVIDRFEEEEFPLAVMYSLTYQGKRMLSDTKYLYQDFSSATVRFQMELSTVDESVHLVGGRCVSCHTHSVNSTLGEEGEDSVLNICQLVWECWGENASTSTQYGMLLFDLDQWYKDQMPATYRLESNAFMSATWCPELARGSSQTLDVRLDPVSVSPYSHATRLEEHFYPNSLQYNCICLNTSESCLLSTIGIQRQIISSIDEVGPTALLNPLRLYNACVAAGLTPLYMDTYARNLNQEEQRRFLLSVALEARLSRFLKRCAHDWATGSHTGAGCTLTFLVDWCWKRAIELKENAKELTAPLFASASLPDRNVVRCLEHCVQQLTQLAGLLDAVLTKCCNLVVPDALSEMEEKYKGIGTVSLYFQVVQWFLRVGLLPERLDSRQALPYPAQQLYTTYNKRRVKLKRLQNNGNTEDEERKSCSLLYIDELIEQEFGGERIHQMWMKGGSECNGLYPPPSLYSLLRLYLLPDIAEEHKHSLVLYLLVDYSMIYDEVRYEAVIRRLMQFPTMFGLSNTAIKATQAFWHLDHRDFDFALDQLQCLTGNTLSEWQHNVVLSSLLAQKKTQAALQYLHVRKPAPIQNVMRDKDGDMSMNCSNRVNDHDKLEDWQSCCNLYLARELVFEALDVIRMCVQNAGSLEDKVQILNFFFKGCRNTGQLSKILQVTLLPFEEEVFIKYLENCNETQTSDILIMYFLQQARYLEAQQYNKRLQHPKSRAKEVSTSAESLLEVVEREGARDTLVDVVCAALPAIAATVARCATAGWDVEPHVIVPKPMSVFVQAKSPKNTFTYKSSFIQDTIQNASETWINKPKMQRGIKRALNIEDTPFICTPKLGRTKSIFSMDLTSESTPPKRVKLDLSGTPKTPKPVSGIKVSDNLSRQMEALLDMPEVQSPDLKLYGERADAGTPHSILKTRRHEGLGRGAPSPGESTYLGDSDDELLETASNHTHYSDKHLRFTIPTTSESGSTPSPPLAAPAQTHGVVTQEKERSVSVGGEKEMDISGENYTTGLTRSMNESHPLESPPKKLATEDKMKSRKSLKDSVRARRSLSISANSSLSDDPNTSIESIADIPVTLINPRYYGEKRHRQTVDRDNESVIEIADTTRKEDSVIEIKDTTVEGNVGVSPPKTPTGRRGIRSVGESTPLVHRSRSVTPERQDSPVVLRTSRITRSRSRTPEVSPRSSPLAPIPEQPKQEVESEPHAQRTTLSVPRQIRSRSRTPDRVDKGIKESPRLEAITESPTKSSNSESPSSSPTRRSLRSRSRTPEVDITEQTTSHASPRALRSHSKTPEKLMSPKIERASRSKKPLSRMVLEANAFAKSKQITEKNENEPIATTEDAKEADNVLECTPMKSTKEATGLMDVTFSPIVNKSLLQSSVESVAPEDIDKVTKTEDESVNLQPLPTFTINETAFEKSVLHSYQSSVESPTSVQEDASNAEMKSLPAFTINETYFEKSVLSSYQSSAADGSQSVQEVSISVTKELKTKDPLADESALSNKSVLKDVSCLMTSDSDIEMKAEKGEWKAKIESQDKAAVIQKEKEKIVEIEREINEIEGDMSDDSHHTNDNNDTSGDEEIIEGDESERSSESNSSDESSEDKASDDEEIISINDSNSDESFASSSENKLEIDEQTSSSGLNREQEQQIEAIVDVQIETVSTDNDNKVEEVSAANEASATDPLNQGNFSILTDDNSVLQSDNSDINLNYSNDKEDEKQIKNKNKDKFVMKTDGRSEVQIEVIVEEIAPTTAPVAEETANKSLDVVDATTTADNTNIESEETKNKENIEELKKDKVEEVKMEEESETLSSRSRKRSKSTSSNRSTKKSQESEKEKASDIIIEAPKTPMTRKRTKSTASNKSTTELEQIEVSTPSSRTRAKTPNTEVRKIITRRASRELSEKMDESKDSALEDSVLSVPKTRSTRSRSKNVDDNASVASESSVKSTRSKASEDADVKPSQVRKGRKSILHPKPDLAVIPETTSEETGSKLEDNEAIINEYSSSRRLTRHQKAVLESWLEPKQSPRRRPSTASRASAPSEPSQEDDDASSTHSAAFDVQPIDRITLLNKTDFQGSPDAEESQRTDSPDSHLDAAKHRRSRLARAASESRSVPKAAKVIRRVSVDIAATPERGSPTPGSPARGRRASFNRACEALHTPKGRRPSTDVKGETISQQGSPQGSPAPLETETPVTPARPRRASTQSNASQAKSDTSKKSKKTSAVEEIKDTKKK